MPRLALSTVQLAVREYWTAAAALVGLCILAYLTKPDPASFRTHLTSLSFHTHMRRLSSPSRSRSATQDAPDSATPNGVAASSATSTNGKADSPGASTAKRKGAGTAASSANAAGSSDSRSSSAKAQAATANRHILSFSNRISLSIRTPSYKFTSYHFFSTVYVPSSRPHRAIPGVKKQQQLAAQRNHPEMSALLGLGGELWFGVFGRWFALRWWDSEDSEEEERRGRLEKGVREMVVEDNDPTDGGSNYASANSASASGASTPSHQLSHGLSALNDSRSLTAASDASAASAAVNNKNASQNSRLSKRVFRAGQRRPSPTSLTRLKTKAEHAAREALEAEQRSAREHARSASKDDSTASAAGSGGGVNGSGGAGSVGGGGDDKARQGHVQLGSAATDPILLELQAQLDELRATAAESEKRLQDELEVLRGKKRDEDAFRAELKAKTKGLEESKRVADARRAEAEKELNERKAVVKEAQSRVDKLRDEIRALERKGLEAIERKEKKKRERKEREKKLRDDVGKKRDELKEKEKGLEEVMQKVGEMERKLEVRRALLAGRRNDLIQYAQQGMRGVQPVPMPQQQQQQQQQPPPLPLNPVANGGMYPVAPAVPPQAAAPATATLGGVGVFASAFAAPFGQGGYGRRNYPYVHPLSANNSRPTSIRSGHFDPLTGAFQSAPSSPTLAPSNVPFDDHLPYSAGAAVDPASGWPTSFASGPNGAPHSLPHAGFLEHRLQHRAAHDDDSHPHLLPFDGRTLGDLAEVSPSLSDFPNGDPIGLDANGEDGEMPRPRTLALPMQYLESGLLASGTETPGTEGPLSPMTPHQTSLIPSQLFHLLDEDEDEDALFNMPDSPTLRGALGPDNAADWQGLGLQVNRAAAKPTQSRSNSNEEFSTASPKPQEGVVPTLAALRRDSNGGSSGTRSATTSPVGPPPTSPFTAWATEPTPTTTSSSQDSPSFSHPIAALNGISSAAPGAHLTHRLSPSQDLDDDLPRAGLSLNPDAKAFAFSSMGPGGLMRTSSPGPGGARTNRLSFPGSSQASPTAPASPSPLSNNIAAIGSGAGAFSARLSPAHDWPTTSPAPPLPAVAPIGSGLASKTTAFNPFDAEDDLLGPLK
ncbi:hypothetical protein JCM10908_006430 [Rhodotorula pacifica]|uniref:uncharacterized protein n=1 Tax=Rhodotorula pacifica TaxID=1495444 RepID=UPI00316DB83A